MQQSAAVVAEQSLYAEHPGETTPTMKLALADLTDADREQSFMPTDQATAWRLTNASCNCGERLLGRTVTREIPQSPTPLAVLQEARCDNDDCPESSRLEHLAP